MGMESKGDKGENGLAEEKGVGSGNGKGGCGRLDAFLTGVN